MRPQDIPGFIYRGAIVSVDGKEETVRDFSLETPLINGRPIKGALSLYLKFNGGLSLEYDLRRVREIPGKLPAFIHEGARLFLKHPVPKGAKKRPLMAAANGEWEITGHHFEKNGDSQRLRLTLKRPGTRDAILSVPFNPRTMTSCPPDPSIPVYALRNDLVVGKPPALKPRK